MLAQEQDSFGGGFSINQCFIGMLTNVNVWDHVLSPAEIEKMSKSCLSGEGNVYKWSDFIHGLKGETRVVIPSPCKRNYKFANIKRCKFRPSFVLVTDLNSVL